MTTTVRRVFDESDAHLLVFESKLSDADHAEMFTRWNDTSQQPTNLQRAETGGSKAVHHWWDYLNCECGGWWVVEHSRDSDRETVEYRGPFDGLYA